jgi:glycerol-3-phosphate O-acyltransferase / dihydroxyacetone phosphate acyltransferase
MSSQISPHSAYSNDARALRRAFRVLLGLFFREITVAGPVPTRATAGRMFVANHNNGLLDAALILTACDFPISPLAKAPLWKIPVLRTLLDAASAVPVHRRRDDPNKASDASATMFQDVAVHLTSGGNTLIFPEGTSHTEPDLLPLRTGAARMLQLACRLPDASPAPLSFQAVALEFDDKELFRSRVAIVFGQTTVLAAPGADVEADVLATTEQMRLTLTETMLNTSTSALRGQLLLLGQMFQNSAVGAQSEAGQGHDGSVADLFRRAREAENVERRVPAGPLRDNLATELEQYQLLLAQHKVSDAWVAGRPEPRATLPVVWGPAAALGLLLLFVPYKFTRLFLRWSKPTPDVTSTHKLGVSLLAFPVWTVLLLVLAALSSPWAFAAALALLPWSAWCALLWIDDRDSKVTYGQAVDDEAAAALKKARAQVMLLAEEALARYPLP